jgi:hypothetical protein
MPGIKKRSFSPPDGSEVQPRAAKITRQINKYQTQPPAKLLDADDKVTNEFPAVLVPRDPYDDTFATKARNAQQNPYTGEPVQFIQELTAEDIAYQKRKQEDVNKLRYDSWFMSTLDMSNPVEVQLAREKGLLKEYFDSREKTIDYWHEISRQIAKMRLLGRSYWGPEDYRLAFAIKTGVLKLPKGSLFDPKSYLLGEASEANIKRGFFNPLRLFKGLRSRYLRTHEDPFPDLSAPKDSPLVTGIPGADTGSADLFGVMDYAQGPAYGAPPFSTAPMSRMGGPTHL